MVGRHVSRRAGVVAAATVTAFALVATAPAAAAVRHRVTVRASASGTGSATVTVSRFADVVATAAGTTAPQYFTGRGTAAGSATATARATATASATVSGTASLATLRAQARSRARTLAARAATAKARATAAARARAAAIERAEFAATADADTAASGAAQSGARTQPVRLALVATGDPSVKPCGAPLRKADGTLWVCTFDDEFSGSALDPRKWSALTTDEMKYHQGNACFVDDPANVNVSADALHLTVRTTASPVTCATNTGPMTTTVTAADVASINKFSQAYGRFAVRAKFPATTIAGLHAALWLWPQNYAYGMLWPLSGEIDIAEEYSVHADRAIPYVHYVYDPATVDLATSTNVTTNDYCLVNDVGAYHEYALEWTPQTMTILYDNKVCLIDRYSAANQFLQPMQGSAPFDQPFFVALTQAIGIGGNAYDPARTPLPATTSVDWVRVWR